MSIGVSHSTRGRERGHPGGSEPAPPGTHVGVGVAWWDMKGEAGEKNLERSSGRQEPRSC